MMTTASVDQLCDGCLDIIDQGEKYVKSGRKALCLRCAEETGEIFTDPAVDLLG